MPEKSLYQGSGRGLIHEWFEARAAACPEAVAVRCEGWGLTYGDLNRRANRLARRLRDLGVGPNVLVGLSAERSLDLIVGIVAILKAGGAYLPIDPSYPAHRQALLVADAGAPILLTQAALRDIVRMSHAFYLHLGLRFAKVSQSSWQKRVFFSGGELPRKGGYADDAAGREQGS